MIKLFNRSKTIPTQYKPDQNLIAQLEKEFKLDDDGFDERYDEMLIDDFKSRWSDSEWDFETLEDEVLHLMCELMSDKGHEIADELFDEVREEKKYAYPGDLKSECDALRDRMTKRGKRRDY